ncbi:MAG: hypothetical protein HPM95_12375 [Alphaproteobacteria bacterium]|nr:hypothetical protein [Alphaproteobacteria bacterium]
MRVGAPPRLSVLPRLSLGLDDVSLQGRGWSLTNARLTARLDLSALLGGTTRLASLAIDNPTIRIAAPLEERPQAAYAPPVARCSASCAIRSPSRMPAWRSARRKSRSCAT